MSQAHLGRSSVAFERRHLEKETKRLKNMKSFKGNYNTISKFANTSLVDRTREICHCRRKSGTCNRICIRNQKLNHFETKHADKFTTAKFSLRLSNNFFDAQFWEKNIF